jgi:hypothetical protein
VLKQAEMAAASAEMNPEQPQEPILGKDYFRNPTTNYGFYSKKREGVSDVDPKVSPPTFSNGCLGDGAI